MPPLVPDLVHGRGEHGVAEKVTVLDALADAGEVLIDDAAGADIEMADLRIAHLPFGQPDIRAAGAQAGGGIVPQQGIEPRGSGQADGIRFAACR